MNMIVSWPIDAGDGPAYRRALARSIRVSDPIGELAWAKVREVRADPDMAWVEIWSSPDLFMRPPELEQSLLSFIEPAVRDLVTGRVLRRFLEGPSALTARIDDTNADTNPSARTRTDVDE